MNQEHGSSRWYDGGDPGGSQGELLEHALADLPLPASAVVIDVRQETTYDYPLLWNLATEIEDLATQMRLKRIPHWEYLEECIDFLLVSIEQMSQTSINITLTSRSDKRSFSSDEDFAGYVNSTYINRVRSNRQSASVHQRKGVSSSLHLAAGPVQSMVRVFLLIDMEKEDTFTQAIQYASLLKGHNYDYDDPERTGRDERLSVFAVCMNANPRQRDKLFRLNPAFETVFDTVILVQAYRDDDTFIGDDIQAYEVEQILYALLLASPGEITNHEDSVGDEDIGRYLAFVERPPVASSCSIYMMGVSSTEYSARWGQRWMSNGLVAKLIELIGDKQEVEYGDALLQVPNDQQDFDSWWVGAQNLLPNLLPVLLPQTRSVMARPAFMTSVQTQFSLAMTTHHVEALRLQAEEWYENATQQALKEALESITYLPAMIKNKARERNKRSRESLTPEDLALRDTIELQKRAQHLLVSLFHGAKGALPRALLQLDALTAKFQELHKQTQRVPEIIRFREAFEQDVEKCQWEMRRPFETWQVPLFGEVLRSNVLTGIFALGIALVLVLGTLILLAHPWKQLTTPLFSSFAPWVSKLVLCLMFVIFVLLGTIIVIIRRGRKLNSQRDATLKSLYGRLQTQQSELQSLLTVRSALQLLALSGLYHDGGEMCAYGKRLRVLEGALKEAHDEAVNGQQRAFERLRLSLSATQVGIPDHMTWLNLNTRRDWLPWSSITRVFQNLYERFEEGDVFFDELTRKMLQNAAPDLIVPAFVSESQPSLRADRVDDRKEIQFLASELVAAMISAKLSGYNLVRVEPQIQRYLTLQARTLQEPSLLTESITSLEQTVKDLQLEQLLNGTSSPNTYDSFFLKRNRTLDQILSAWVNHYCQLETDVQSMLEQQVITVRLQEEHISPDDTIADLQARYQLFGYHDFTLESGYDHFYLLLVPGIASKDFFASLDHIQLPHFQWVRFPDEEKLIYMHVHRTHLQRHSFSIIKSS